MIAAPSVLRLLLIEDDEVEALALRRSLQKFPSPLEITSVATVAEASRLLQEQSFDILCMDHSLPDGTAFDVLARAGNLAEQVAFLITGVGDESIAAAALRAGVAGYMVKDVGGDYLRQLPLQLDQSLQKLRLQAALRKSEERLRALFDSTGDMIVSCDRSGTILLANALWTRTLAPVGGERDDWSFPDLVRPQDRPVVEAAVARVLTDGVHEWVAFSVRAHDGRLVSLEGRIYPDKSDRAHSTWQGFFQDVSRRTATEDRLRETGRQLDALLESSTAMLYRLHSGADQKFAYFSPNCARLLGWSTDQLKGPGFFRLKVHPGDREHYDSFRQSGPQKPVGTLIYRLQSRDGAWRVLMDQTRLMDSPSEAPGEIVGVLTDITERVEAEDQERARQEQTIRMQTSLTEIQAHREDELQLFLRQITSIATRALRSSVTGIWFGELGSEQWSCNNVFESAAGSHRSGLQIFSARIPEFLAALDREGILCIEDIDRDPRAVGVNGSELVSTDGAALLVLPIQFSQRMEGFLALAFPRGHDVHDGAVIKYARSLVTEVLVGFTRMRRIAAEADAQELRRHLQQLVEQRTAALFESESRFRQLAENIGDVFYIYEAKTARFSYVSPAFEKLWARTVVDVMRQPTVWVEAVHPEDRVKFAQLRFSKEASERGLEYRLDRNDGTECWIHERWFPMLDEPGASPRLAGFAVDITNQKQEEVESLRLQRMDVIGSLASGLAHDLNNAIAPATLGFQMLHRRFPEESSLLSSMESSLKHAGKIVRQLLTFARGTPAERLPIDTDAMFREINGMLDSVLPSNIAIDWDIEPGLWPLHGDATQLHQLLINLCLNARDAMTRGGTIRLEARNQRVDAAFSAGVGGAHPGNYVVWRVVDQGTGIPDSILERIFDPFFTTKSVGGGTGLGLASVVGIARSHAGFVRVESKVGKGSIFWVYLPAGGVSVEPGPAPVLDACFRGQGEMILIVDDERSICDVLGAVVEAHGFKLLTAASGPEALVRATEHRAQLSAVLTDIHMPEFGGVDLIRTLRHLLPGIPIAAMSGRYEEAELAALTALGVSLRLQKPFNEEALLGLMQKLLGPASGPEGVKP